MLQKPSKRSVKFPMGIKALMETNRKILQMPANDAINLCIRSAVEAEMERVGRAQEFTDKARILLQPLFDARAQIEPDDPHKHAASGIKLPAELSKLVGRAAKHTSRNSITDVFSTCVKEHLIAVAVRRLAVSMAAEDKDIGDGVGKWVAEASGRGGPLNGAERLLRAIANKSRRVDRLRKIQKRIGKPGD